MRVHIVIAVLDIPNSSIFRTLICSWKIWSRDVVKQTVPEDERAVKKGKSGRARKKRKECKGRSEEESMFPKKKSSRERSRLSAYQVGEILEALSSSRFLSSLALDSPPRINFAPSPPLPFCIFFFSLSYPSRAYVLKESVLSPEYLDYRQLPSCLHDRPATCIAIYISASLVNMLIIRTCFFVFSLNNFSHLLNRAV